MSRTYCQISLPAIAKNFRALSGIAAGACNVFRGAVPMVKCNAYGHGAPAVASTLEREKNALALGVATLVEARALREAGVRKPIWIFSECAPWDEEAASAAEAYQLTPILHSLEDLKKFLSRRYAHLHGKVGFHLKFNSGLNRLGIDLSDAQEVFEILRRKALFPQGICSHLASSESPTAPETRHQVSRFQDVVRRFSSFNASYIHCVSTGGILRARQLGLSDVCNVVRPGIGIYGYGGADGEKAGLKPALTWHVRVMRVRELSSGDRVGYGATYRARKPMPESILGVGYGDGFFRSLSNGKILIGPASGPDLRKAAVLGRVSMDLTAINMRLKPGSWVTLLGNSCKQGETFALSAGTIVYEVLTAISGRVPRIYG